MTGTDSTLTWQRFALHSAKEMYPLLAHVVTGLTELGFSDKDRFSVRLALEEAIANALKHGNGGDPARGVHVRYRADRREFLVEVEDEGTGFDPAAVPDPRAPENLERPGGRGVFLMRHYMTWVRYNARGNTVTLCKHRSPGPTSD
jgi:serine/threonine-protein kinase RsbW